MCGCGRKLPEEDQDCECGFPGDEKLFRRIRRDFGIADDAVKKERAAWLLGKKLEPYMRVAQQIILLECAVLAVLTAVTLLAGTNPMTIVLLGVPMVCLLTYCYFMLERGVERRIGQIDRVDRKKEGRRKIIYFAVFSHSSSTQPTLAKLKGEHLSGVSPSVCQ